MTELENSYKQNWLFICNNCDVNLSKNVSNNEIKEILIEILKIAKSK